MVMTALFAHDFDIAVGEAYSTMANFSNSQEEVTQGLYDADNLDLNLCRPRTAYKK
jgi:hypothetical protein